MAMSAMLHKEQFPTNVEGKLVNSFEEPLVTGKNNRLVRALNLLATTKTLFEQLL